MDGDRAGACGKACAACGVDLAGRARVKDAKGRYYCQAFAETREACRHGDAFGLEAGGVGDGLGDGVEDDGPMALQGPDDPSQLLPIALEAERGGGGTCPVCSRRFAPDGGGCVSCGYTRRGGILSSRLIEKTIVDGASRVLCTECGYDMGAGASLRCTECGTVAKLVTLRTREQDIARAVARDAYLRPLITAAASLVLMMIARFAFGGLGSLGVYGLEFGATLLFGWAVYSVLCLFLLGFDAPQHLIVLRLAAVYAASDLAFLASGFIPIPIIPWVLAGLTYISLLMYFLEVEMSDALILIAATLAAKAIAVLVIVGMVVGMSP